MFLSESNKCTYRKDSYIHISGVVLYVLQKVLVYCAVVYSYLSFGQPVDYHILGATYTASTDLTHNLELIILKLICMSG